MAGISRAFIQQQVVLAFKQLGDIPRPFTYYQRSGVPVRDSEAGTTTYPLTAANLPLVVFAKFKEEEFDGKDVILNDQKLLFPRLHLKTAAGAPIIPRSADYMVDENGFVWEIQRELGDPAGALVTLQVRTSRKVP